MAVDSDNVRVLTAGALYYAVAGTTLPTNALTALNVAFKDVGYLGEDGITYTPEQAFNKIKDIAGDVVRTVRTDHSVEYKATLLETNVNVINMLFDSDGTVTAYDITNEVMDQFAFVFEVNDGDAAERHVIPTGRVTSVGEVSLTNSDARDYEITIEALPDSSGVKAKVYFDDDGVS